LFNSNTPDHRRGTNVTLFNAAASAGIKRFVLISAAAVSTDRRRQPVIVDEAAPAGRPITAYGRSSC
jgi:UDP-glucose 4-epimerase